jgi:hypothetical protein
MAGEWIKMRLDLAEDPAVIAMGGQTGLDEFAVVGRLQNLWSWADRQSRDGHAVGVTEKWIDARLRCDGFAKAMQSVGWLHLTAKGIEFPNFDRHNGESAKKRALGTVRKAKQRAGLADPDAAESASQMSHDVSHKVSRIKRDKSETREEKRREEDKNPSGSKASSKSTRAKGTKRVPDDFVVTDDMQAWAAEKAPLVNWQRETETFRDWEFQHARTDWAATWRTWMRNAQTKAEEKGTGIGHRIVGSRAADWTESAA